MPARMGDTRSELLTGTLNERILQQCHQLYTDPENGLIKMAKNMSLTLLAPRKKITVLLIGNHSAGKSSFINWYIEEHVQKTGVAIETQGIAFVTSGKKRETLTGNATLHLYSHFEPMRKIEGVVDYLTTEISTSKQKNFNLVTFIDTPGLVDGGMKYPFDVNNAILWLGDQADLIFVFFEPMGQALCKRTLDLVEELSLKNGERMKFYLSKADEAGNDCDRQRVLMQIVQGMCKKPSLNRTCLDIPTIYIPNPALKCRCTNQIDETTKEIERTINQTIQNTLNSLEGDCEKISSLIDARLQEDRANHDRNFGVWTFSLLLCFIGLSIPSLIFVCFSASLLSRGHLNPLFNSEFIHASMPYAEPLSTLWSIFAPSFTSCLGISAVCALLVCSAKFYSKKNRKPTLTKRRKHELLENKEYVVQYVKGKKESLYKEYLKDCVLEHDMP